MKHPVQIINVSINRPAAEVYRYASNPENLPQWLSFVQSICRENAHWRAESDLGSMLIDFAPANEFGIIDHKVTLENGDVVLNPMRIIESGNGCQVLFTLCWLPGRSEADFNEDAKAVKADLQTLKKRMES